MHNTQFYQHAQLPELELRYSDNNHGCYALHTHDEYAFGAVLGGCTRYQVRQKHYVVQDNGMMLIAPNVPHVCNHVIASGSGWRYLMLYVGADYWQQLSEEFSTITAMGQPIYDDELLTLFIDLHQYWQQQPDDVLGIENAWLLCFQRLAELQAARSAISKTDDTLALSEALAWVKTNLVRSFTLSDWATELSMSRAQLLRLFREHLNISPHQYCLNQRVQHAKQLLKQGETLSSTAYQLGFADQAHFQRTFKRYTAVTPRQYQKNR